MLQNLKLQHVCGQGVRRLDVSALQSDGDILQSHQSPSWIQTGHAQEHGPQNGGVHQAEPIPEGMSSV